MKLQLAVLLAAALVLVAANPPTEQPARALVEEVYHHLPVFGAPLVGIRYGDQPADGLVTQEALGWRALYDAPFIMAVQHEALKPELTCYLIKDGLRSLPFAEDPHRRALLNLLLTGPEKLGVLLSGSNFVSLPQIDMPITRFILPPHFSLAESARLHADFYSFPTLLVVGRDEISQRDLVRLAMVGDFVVLPDSIKVSNDVPAPAAKWGRRGTTAYSIVNKVNSAPQASLFASQFAPGVEATLTQSSYQHNPFLSKFAPIH